MSRLRHLLRRTEFVARPDRVMALVSGSLEEAVDDILDFPTDPVTLPPELLVHETQLSAQWVSATNWLIDRMAFDSPRPLQEKMTLFWSGHFVSQAPKVRLFFLMAAQNKLYRDNAIGNFRDFTQAMATDPAMLLYLDNAFNVASGPNQNFARELMELFVLGVGNYSETDVESAAKAWTGHGVNQRTKAYEFHPLLHDQSPGDFLGESRSWNGPETIDHMLRDKSASAKAAARLIAKKLWEYFAYSTPSAALVDELAAPFSATWNIHSLLRSIFLREEFYSVEAVQGMVRSPVEWVAAVSYASGIRSGSLRPSKPLENMGQRLFDPPNVSGWRTNGYWVNPSAFGSRAGFAERVSLLWERKGSLPETRDFGIAQAVRVATTLVGVPDPSGSTISALSDYLAAQRAAEPEYKETRNLITMALMSPEMHTN